MTRDKEIKVKVTAAEKQDLKNAAGHLNLSNYVRNKLFSANNDSQSKNKEVSRAKFKRVPDINRQVYLELSEISTELQKLGNWGDDLSETDRAAISQIRAKIARLGLETIGVSENSLL